MATGFLEDALRSVARSVDAVRVALGGAEPFRALLRIFGWELDPAVDDARFATIAAIFAPELAILNALPGASAATLATQIPALFAALVVPRVPSATWPAPLSSAAFWNDGGGDPGFGHELVDALLHDALAASSPVALGVLRFAGVFVEQDRAEVAAAPGVPARAAYTRRSIDWDRLGSAIAEPGRIPADVYGWGGAFDHAGFLGGLEALFEGLTLCTALGPTSNATFDFYFDRVATSPSPDGLLQLSLAPVALHSAAGPTFGSGKLTLNALPVPPAGARTGSPVGFAFFPLLTGQFANQVDLADGVALRVRGDYAAAPVAVEVRPDATVLRRLGAGTGNLDAELRVTATATGAPWKLVGTDGGTRLELAAAHFAIAAQGPVASPLVTIEVGIDRATLVVDFGAGDSFLQSIFGGAPQSAELACAVSWSNRTGFHFGGQAHLEVAIPVHESILGVVDVETVQLGFGAGSGRLVLDAGLSGKVHLGPVTATVDRVGLELGVEPRGDGSGALGPLDLDCRFRPPTGLGLAISCDAITAGGDLSLDADSGRYAGVLQVQLLDIGVEAIGLLDTKLPGGGYSFLLIIAANLPPIQLGFGFILDGVGGLAGIQRTVVVDAIQAGVRNHALDHILFPPDPVAAAPQIIADVETIFPPAPGHQVFGPMARLGWGTPRLITAELGLLFEFPGPRIALLGQVEMMLPSSDAALIELHIEIAGILDVPGKRVSIDASLHDSRVAAFSVFGDAAFRLSWGDPPSFALAVGGMNPQFQPPPGFPTLRRVGVSLGFEHNPRISVQGYFALTSNSAQFGALAEVYAEALDFNIHGWLGFDALFVFHPFSFRFDYSAGFALRHGDNVIGGIHVTGLLSGVSPWHVRGEATISVLFFDVSVGFEATFGEARQIVPPTLDPWSLLRAAVESPQSWSAILPADGFRAVSVAAAPGSAALVEPMGGLTMRQRVLPLNRSIAKLGEATIQGPGRYDVSAVSVGAQPVAAYSTVTDYFAPAQYQELSDAEKLSSPSFEPMDAGLTLWSDAMAVGPGIARQLDYETIIVDSPWDGREMAVWTLGRAAQLAMVAAGACARSQVRATGLVTYEAAPPAGRRKIGFDDESYAIASTTDLTLPGDFATAMPKGEALRVLAEHLRVHPEERGRLQVVARHLVTT